MQTVVYSVTRGRWPKAAVILVVFTTLAVAGLWYSRQQGQTLIVELAYVLALCLVATFVADRVLIR